ncbi:MAG: tetratricopeptide repeat protein, partial [Isosphaeraceae bacterium]
MRIPAAILSLAAALVAASAHAETSAELTDRLRSAGKLAEAESSLAKILAEHPDDAEARYGLGVTRFLRAVERMSQSFYRYGL